MYIFIYIYIYIYIVFKCVCIHIYKLCVCVYIYIYILCVGVYRYFEKRIFRQQVIIQASFVKNDGTLLIIFTFTHTHTYIYIYIYICVCVHVFKRWHSTLKGGPLKLVDKFTYLGSSVSSTENDIVAKA